MKRTFNLNVLKRARNRMVSVHAWPPKAVVEIIARRRAKGRKCLSA